MQEHGDAVNHTKKGSVIVTTNALSAHLTPQAAPPEAVAMPVARPLPLALVPLQADVQSTGTTFGTNAAIGAQLTNTVYIEDEVNP